jgi:hypothetical protein
MERRTAMQEIRRRWLERGAGRVDHGDMVTS